MRRRRAAALVVALGVLAACGSSSGPKESGGPTPSMVPDEAGVRGEIRVEAAASLTEAFTQIGKAFEADHPGTKVVLDFGPSSGLADGIIAGSPADVFASADTKNMDKLVTAKEVAASAPVVFARNQPEIAVPKGNPGHVTGLADLAEPDLLVGLCAAEVPCGKFARAVLDKAGVTPSIDTNEEDVKALLAKITSDDLDVGIVYHTDVVASAGKVEGIEIPATQNVIASYPVAVLTGAKNVVGGTAFADYVVSAQARAVLAKFGFLAAA